MGKETVPRSPHKKPITTIALPRIPEGVRVPTNLLGYVEKLRYSNHDVTDTDKFP
jgi:hypothetical protein